MYYLYDDSFYGLLTAIFLCYKNKSKNAEIKSVKYFKNCSFFDIIEVTTDDELAERVLNGCRNKISDRFVHQIYILYLSDLPETGNIISEYIAAGLKYGKYTETYLNVDTIGKAMKLYKRILFENHRLKGLLRFRKAENFYVADISPDYNILPIFYKHFENRMCNENWIIRDTKRKRVVIRFNGTTNFSEYTDEVSPEIKEDEFEHAWKVFYKTIAIDERTNHKLRQSFMPKKYWKNIIEMYDTD